MLVGALPRRDLLLSTLGHATNHCVDIVTVRSEMHTPHLVFLTDDFRVDAVTNFTLRLPTTTARQRRDQLHFRLRPRLL